MSKRSVVSLALAAVAATSSFRARPSPPRRPRPPPRPRPHSRRCRTSSFSLPAARSPACSRRRASRATSPAASSIDSLIKAAPGIEKLAGLDGEQIASIGSQDMNDAVWLQSRAARRTSCWRSRTWTGSWSPTGPTRWRRQAFFLNLLLKSDKPVVLVGSMRPATLAERRRAAQPRRTRSRSRPLPTRAAAACSWWSNDEIHTGRDVHKTHTTAVQTFVSPDPRHDRQGPSTARSRYGYMPSNRHTTTSEFSLRRRRRRCRASTSSTPMRARRHAVEGRGGRGSEGHRARRRRRRQWHDGPD